jgi:hypothetical protein
MPKNGVFPGREAERNQYYQIVVPYLLLAANVTRLLISLVNKTALTTYFAQWNAAFSASQNKDTATSTVIDNKQAADKGLQTVMRAIYADIPESILTPQDRNTLNLQLRSKTSALTQAPTTKPVTKVDISKRLEHTVFFVDELTLTSRAKPEGVRGCQIWYKIGTPAIDPSELTYVMTDTASPQVIKFKGEDAGKNVYYWLRWESTRGEVGPWSDVIIATIGG